MRLATVVTEGRTSLAVAREHRVLLIDPNQPGFESMRALAASGDAGLARLHAWVDAQPTTADLPATAVRLGPVVPDPGAIYTVGLNYRDPAHPEMERPPRPLIYGKASSSVAAHESELTWDRSLTANVDAEVELGVVIGSGGRVFGYTIINDISSRDPWLDGDQWLMGKSMPGFCPVGPWLVTTDELDPAQLRLGATIDEAVIQAGNTGEMLYSIEEILAYLSRHAELRPGDLIATGTPARSPGPPGPQRHLETGDTVVAWIDGIGSLTTIVG